MSLRLPASPSGLRRDKLRTCVELQCSDEALLAGFDDRGEIVGGDAVGESAIRVTGGAFTEDVPHRRHQIVGIDFDTDVVSGITDATDREVCVYLWSAPGQPALCTADFGPNGEWSVDFDDAITPQSTSRPGSTTTTVTPPR